MTTTTATTDESTGKTGRYRSPGAAERSARRRVEYLERLARRAAFDQRAAAERAERRAAWDEQAKAEEIAARVARRAAFDARVAAEKDAVWRAARAAVAGA